MVSSAIQRWSALLNKNKELMKLWQSHDFANWQSFSGVSDFLANDVWSFRKQVTSRHDQVLR